MTACPAAPDYVEQIPYWSGPLPAAGTRHFEIEVEAAAVAVLSAANGRVEVAVARSAADVLFEAEVAPSAPTAPMGWYPNPGCETEIRWWDGSRWTEHTLPKEGARSVSKAESALSTNADDSHTPARRLGDGSVTEPGDFLAATRRARSQAESLGLEFVDLERYQVNAAAASVLPERFARHNQVVAIGWKFNTPVIAVASPDNVVLMDDIGKCVGRGFKAVVACSLQVEAWIERMYRSASAAQQSW